MLLAILEGRTTVAALKAIEGGLATADAARDPSGIKLLESTRLFARGDLDAAYELLAAAEIDDSDVLALYTLAQLAFAMRRTDDATALVRRLHETDPRLQFGADLAESFRAAGRKAAADALIRAWVTRAPENVVARLELVRIEAAAGNRDEAVANARRAVLIHGERSQVFPELFDAAIESGQYAEAHRIADRMLLGSALDRARGRFRVAVAAVFDGRFAAAYDSARRAIEDHRTFGLQSELFECLELVRALAPVMGDPEMHRHATRELADAFDAFADDAIAAATRFELALLERRGAPPSVDAHLAGLDPGAQRDVARRRMLRAAAIAECGSPHKAVAAGFSPFEENTASLVALGTCALRLRELEVARDGFERATRVWSSLLGNQSCAYHAIVAHFHLGGVLVELGDVDGARRQLTAFLRCWDHADRAIPEIAAARGLLAIL